MIYTNKMEKKPKFSVWTGYGPMIIMVVFLVLVIVVSLYYKHRISEILGG